MAAKRFQLDPETLELLQVIESSDEDDQRRVAIMDLARRGGMNAARILTETFERSMWRSTKFSIIQAMGLIRHERATEFLCQTAMHTDDFAMSAEAVLALASTDDPVAGEFLGSIIRTPNHPLLREALTAVANLNFFPCEEEIAGIIQSSDASTPPSILQNAVIAAGLRGYRRQLKPILNFLAEGSSGVLFNTALMTLGRIGDEESLTFLANFDTRYRAFAHQLKVTSMDHLRLRLTYTIEDAVGAALNAKSSEAMRQAWQILASFPQDSTREALQLLAAESSPDFKTLERVTLFDTGNLQEDFKFLAHHRNAIRNELFAALGRKHATRLPREKILASISEFGEEFKVKFLGLVRVERGGEALAEIIGNSKIDQETRISAVNAFVLQSLMCGGNTEIRDQLGKRLVKLIESESDELISGRLIRAIGQLRYLGPDASNLLRERLKSGGSGIEGVYAALARCDTEDSSRMISKRLRQIIASPENEREVRSAIQSFARCSVITDASCLAQLPLKLQEESKIAVLKILCTSSAPELTPFVERCLKEKDFQTRVLSIVAAKTHNNAEIWNCVFNFLDHDNSSIAGRALDTIVTCGGVSEHLKILQRMEVKFDDYSTYKKVFRSLTPKSGESYGEFVKKLDQLISKRLGAMADQDMMQAAINLRDNLMVVGSVNGQGIGGNSKINLSVKERHAIDETMGQSLRGFSKYSETIKSVLRSGEVTWQHPELFDARVDKSTVLVQYVKAIDLLLQEKIGSQMFLAQGADFLQKMQSRIVRLELDDDAGFGPQLVTSLECSMYFSRDSFPAHKLALICRSVMTGLVMKEQYRVVDGLRAWALLLLLFGRSFKYRGQILEPLFPLAKSSSDGICRIARAMNELQEARNKAAHRGTMLDMSNMQETRDLCASLLNDLDAHLLP